MTWVVSFSLAALCGTFFAVFLKMAAGYISHGLNTLAVYLSATLVSIIWLVLSRFGGNQILLTGRGLLFTFLAGIAAASSAAFTSKAYELGANLSVAESFGRVLSVLASVVLGILLFREQISARVAFGALFAIVGIYLLIGGK